MVGYSHCFGASRCMPAYLVSSSVPPRPRHPGVRSFVAVGALEAVVRGIMLSVYPLLMYRAWGDAAVVSLWYFGIGLASLFSDWSHEMATTVMPANPRANALRSMALLPGAESPERHLTTFASTFATSMKRFLRAVHRLRVFCSASNVR